jgi:hypothetical protein
MVADYLTGQREERSVTLVIEFKVAGDVSFVEGSSLPAKAMIAFPTVTVRFAMMQALLSVWKLM